MRHRRHTAGYLRAKDKPISLSLGTEAALDVPLSVVPSNRRNLLMANVGADKWRSNIYGRSSDAMISYWALFTKV